uniref:Uncharacterized protein n=1 Tax=Triticum urartu TaxID=4572 RepID=A0A8R7JZS7_TRIUA
MLPPAPSLQRHDCAPVGAQPPTARLCSRRRRPPAAGWRVLQRPCRSSGGSWRPVTQWRGSSSNVVVVPTRRSFTRHCWSTALNIKGKQGETYMRVQELLDMKLRTKPVDMKLLQLCVRVVGACVQAKSSCWSSPCPGPPCWRGRPTVPARTPQRWNFPRSAAPCSPRPAAMLAALTVPCRAAVALPCLTHPPCCPARACPRWSSCARRLHSVARPPASPRARPELLEQVVAPARRRGAPRTSSRGCNLSWPWSTCTPVRAILPAKCSRKCRDGHAKNVSTSCWAHMPTQIKKRMQTGGRATKTNKKQTKSMSVWVTPLELLLLYNLRPSHSMTI